MNRYPISVSLEGRVCLVVGGGKVAERKVASLLAHRASVRLVSPDTTEVLRASAELGELEWRQEGYDTRHLEDAFLAMACTDNRTVNAQIVADAQERNLLVLCADDPAAGNFVSPAQVTRGALVLTVSTNGGSPTLASVLRERLDAEFGPEWEQLVEIIGAMREIVKTNSDEAARKATLRRVLADAEVHALLQGGKNLEAEMRIRECLRF